MKYLMLLILIALSASAFGQGKGDREIIKQVDKVIAENYKDVAPGCAVLIAKKGQLIFDRGYGLANLEVNVPMKSEMVFRIGSITKQFTAVAILQLVEKGKIALNDTIGKYIKDYSTKGKTITIENLLTHTSGIKGYEQLDSKIPNAIRVDFKPQTIIDSLNRLSLEFEPGSKFNYSNSNYFLLGYIIEQVTGKSYQAYLKENIFDPGGLNSTFYESQVQIIPNRVNGYSYSDGKYWNSDFISMSLVYSAGALRSSVTDLFKWHKGLYEGKFIKKEMLSKAIMPYKLSDGKQIEYGYGFFIKEENNSKVIGHGGAIDGFMSIEMYYPAQDIFISLLCNSDRGNFQQLFQNIADIVLGNDANKQVKELKVSSEVLDSYVGNYKNEEYNESLKIYKVDGKLYGDLSNGTGTRMVLKPLTETKFILPDIRRAKTFVEFVLESGKVKKIIWTQKNVAEFLKIE